MRILSPVFKLSALPCPDCAYRISVADRGDGDTRSFIRCVADLPVSDIDRDMSDSAAVVIEEQVARLDVRKRYLRSASGLSCRVVRKADAKVAEDCHRKPGAVSTACQACTAVHIRIADKLCCIGRNLGSQRRSLLCFCLRCGGLSSRLRCGGLGCGLLRLRRCTSASDGIQVCLIGSNCRIRLCLRICLIRRMVGCVLCLQIRLVEGICISTNRGNRCLSRLAGGIRTLLCALSCLAACRLGSPV